MIKHTFRKNGKGDLQTANLTPIKAIRQNCIECMGFQAREVAECTGIHCPLYPFRMGKAHVPGRARNNSPKKDAPGAVSGSNFNERQQGVTCTAKRRN